MDVNVIETQFKKYSQYNHLQNAFEQKHSLLNAVISHGLFTYTKYVVTNTGIYINSKIKASLPKQYCLTKTKNLIYFAIILLNRPV